MKLNMDTSNSNNLHIGNAVAVAVAVSVAVCSGLHQPTANMHGHEQNILDSHHQISHLDCCDRHNHNLWHSLARARSLTRRHTRQSLEIRIWFALVSTEPNNEFQWILGVSASVASAQAQAQHSLTHFNHKQISYSHFNDHKSIAMRRLIPFWILNASAIFSLRDQFFPWPICRNK